MKKLFFAALAVSALTITSCGGNQSSSNASAADSAQTEASAVAPELNEATQATYDKLTSQLEESVESKDPKAVTTTLANLAATYKALVNAEKLEDALQYGQAIKNFVATNSETLKTIANGNNTINSLLATIAALPTDAATTAEQAKEAVTSDAVTLASSALQKAAATTATATAAAEALQNLPTSAKEAVQSVVNSAVSGAATEAANAETAVKDAATNAVNNAKEEASKKVNEAATKAANKANEKVNEAATKAANSALKKLGL